MEAVGREIEEEGERNFKNNNWRKKTNKKKSVRKRKERGEESQRHPRSSI